MITDTLRDSGDILKIYSEQFELVFENENISDQLDEGLVFMQDYPLRMQQVVNNLLSFDD